MGRQAGYLGATNAISSNFFGGAIKATNAIISNFINALSIRNKCIFSNSYLAAAEQCNKCKFLLGYYVGYSATNANNQISLVIKWL
jgi:hypothetical protein